MVSQKKPEVILRATDQCKYLPPEITIFEIILEKGFAASSDSVTEDWGLTTW